MQPTLPKRLHVGDTVAVLSISWGGPAAYPALFDHGLENISRYLGLKVVELPTARMSNDELQRHPRLRAEDVNAAFRDPEIKAVISSIGGYDSVRILPYIDNRALRENPKIMMGYSDTTTVLSYISLLGGISLYGPSVMGGLAQLESMPNEYLEHLRRFLMHGCAGYRYHWYDSWSDGYPDWGSAASAGQVSNRRANAEGWRWIQGQGGRREGRLWGGCIEVLEFLKGSDYWPDKSFWNDRVVFFETSEAKPPVQQIVYMLRSYGIQEVFERSSAILFGRPKAYTDSEKSDLYQALAKVIGEEFGRPDLPVIANMDFGHTDPKIVLPLGGKVAVDPEEKSVTIVEEFTRD
jgi:muramoyltetrapeptide carboxypeptidase LdcA involved in peptidoglycan recycling